MHRSVGEGFESRAVPAHPHDPRLAGAALLEPFAEAERDPLAVGRDGRVEGSGRAARHLSGIQAGICGLEDARPIGSIRIHDGDRRIQTLLGNDQLAVRGQRGEHVGVPVRPFRIPASGEGAPVFIEASAPSNEQLQTLHLLFPVVCAGSSTLTRALAAVKRYKLSFWDAMLWATIRDASIATLLSEDFQHEQHLDGVQIINPFRLGDIGNVRGG